MKYIRIHSLITLSLCLLACTLFSSATSTPQTPRITPVAPNTKTLRPPTVTATPPTPVVSTVAAALPDLTVYTHISMEGYNGGCVATYTPLVSQVCVENRGTSAAGAFVIHAGGADKPTAWDVDTLAPHQAHCFRTDMELSGIRLHVDPHNTVPESNEHNNEWLAPLPTPPALCTVVSDAVTATPTARPPSPTHTPPATPSTRLTIDSFTLDIADLPDGSKRITFHWQTTGAVRVMLTSGTQHRFPIWWDNLAADGELTHLYVSTIYPNPVMTLSAFNRQDEYITAQQTVAWPCPHTYYFVPPPSACPYLPATFSDAAYQQFEHGRVVVKW